MNIQENKNYQKILNAQDLSLLQFCKLINALLIDYNKKPYTREDIISFFYKAYDNWIYQESINGQALNIIKSFLLALNNKIDEQILTAIVDSILHNLNFDDLKNEFIDILINSLTIRLDITDLYSLNFVNIRSSYFSTLINKYKYDDFTNTVNYIINDLINDDTTKVKRPLDPMEFQNLTDEEDPIDNVLTSTIKPISFPEYRNSAVVVLDKLALIKQKEHTEILNDYREECIQNKYKSYNPNGKNIFDEFNISTLAIGSTFGAAVLLEYVTNNVQDKFINGKIENNNGNFEIIKQALLKKGFKKIYLQFGSPFISRQYQRKAHRLFRFLKI